MANVSDLQERFKSVVTSLQKSVECPVCLETLKTPFKVCARGHGACLECITKLQKCPLCQESFILENLVCIKSVLEALPHLCRYSDDGCEEVVEPGNDHEEFCGYRPIVCRSSKCSVKVPLVQFLDHRKKLHSNWYMCRAESERLMWPLEPDCKKHIYTPVSLFDNLFWILEINDVKEKQLKIYFQATPFGKLEHDYYARLTLEKDNFLYAYTLKATVLSSCESKFEGQEEDSTEEINLSREQFCMKIPQSQLRHFIKDGELSVKYFFFRV